MRYPLVLIAALLGGCADAEEVWLERQRSRCHTMNSNLEYDRDTKTAKCWRVPMLRHPKLMFEERFQGKP